MTLQQPCMAHSGASGKASTNTNTTTTNSEETTTTAFSRKREQLVENSMAVFDRKLHRCLDIAFSEPMKKVGGKRARAAVDSDHDSGVEEDWGVARDTSSGTTAAKEKSKSAKKRARREPAQPAVTLTTPAPTTSASSTTGDGVSLFACPFYANNPVKYKNAKTCLGPGWPTAHRVKEHIYRRHCLKRTCPGCCEAFKSDEELKHHQRLDEPCKKSNRAVDSSNNNNVITDKQEKLIRVRAKTNQPEEERWRELYKILFPEAKRIPSPYYEPAAGSAPATTVKAENEKTRTVNNVPAYTPSSSSTSTSTSRSTTPTAASSPASNRVVRQRSRGGLESIPFRDEAEVIQCKEYLHHNISRAVRPIVEREVDNRLRMVSRDMAQRATDICKEVFTKMFRTWQFGSEQSRHQTPSSRSPQTPDYQEEEEYLPTQVHSYAQAPAVGGYYHTEVTNDKIEEGTSMGAGHIDLLYEQLIPDPPAILGDMFNSDGGLDIESILRELEGNGAGTGADDYSYVGTTASDSAYFSNTATESGMSLGSFGETSSSAWP